MSNAQSEEIARSLRDVAAWLGLFIARGGHKECVSPRHAELTLERIERLAGELDGSAAPMTERLVSALLGMVEQHCGLGDDRHDSMGLSANEQAMELLAAMGYLRVTGRAGRRLLAERAERIAP